MPAPHKGRPKMNPTSKAYQAANLLDEQIQEFVLSIPLEQRPARVRELMVFSRTIRTTLDLLDHEIEGYLRRRRTPA